VINVNKETLKHKHSFQWNLQLRWKPHNGDGNWLQGCHVSHYISQPASSISGQLFILRFIKTFNQLPRLFSMLNYIYTKFFSFCHSSSHYFPFSFVTSLVLSLFVSFTHSPLSFFLRLFYTAISSVRLCSKR